VIDVAAAARIAVSPTRTMEQRGTGDGSNEEDVNNHAIGEEMTATATAADGRPFLGATACRLGGRTATASGVTSAAKRWRLGMAWRN
jgi:hypothetical protein